MAELSGETEQFLRLNISGEKFQLLTQKLKDCANNDAGSEILPRFISLSHDSRMCIAQIHFPKDNEYYFDRSPELFRYIADYYRTSKLHKPQNFCEKHFLDELEFWEIPQDKMSSCCSSEDVAQNSCSTRGRSGRRFGENMPIQDEFSGLFCENFRRKAWTFLEFPSSSIFSKIFCCFSIGLVILSVLEIIMSSMKRFQISKDKAHPVLVWVETCCVLWFSGEYFGRLLLTPKRKKFLLGQLNIIDALSIVPFYLELFLLVIGVDTDNIRNFRGILMTVRILRVLRIVRVFKLARYSKRIQFFVHSIGASSREFGMLLLYLSLCVLLFSTTMYYLEKDDENTKFVDIPTAFWWCVVSMTTVGYGDLIPQTLGGRLVASLAMVSGLIVLAFPITLIVSNFSRFYMAADADTEKTVEPGDDSHNDLTEQLRCLAETDTLYKHALDSLTVAHSKYICIVEELRKTLENARSEDKAVKETSSRGFGLSLRKKSGGRHRSCSPMTIPVTPRVQIHDTEETLIAIPGMGPFVGGSGICLGNSTMLNRRS